MKQSWQDFCSSIDQYTPLSKIWKTVAKISGKFRRSPTPILLLPDGTLMTDKNQVADKRGESFANVSNQGCYSRDFLKLEENCEKNTNKLFDQPKYRLQ